MKRLSFGSGILAICLSAVALAASVHLKGDQRQPAFTDNG